jgi:hypothetical protein
MKKVKKNWNLPLLGPFTFVHCMSKMVIVTNNAIHFAERNFPKDLITKILINLRWKISSPCTNNRNNHFCTLGSLVWKWVGLQKNLNTISKINSNLYVVTRIIHCVQNSEESVCYKLSYHKETFLSTDRQTVTVPNIIQLQYICVHIKKVCHSIVYRHSIAGTWCTNKCGVNRK